MTAKTCTYPGCGRDLHCKGLCSLHYHQGRRLSELKPLVDWKALPCRVEGCDRPSVGRAICRTHQTQKNRGKPLTPLTKGVPCWYPTCNTLTVDRHNVHHCRKHGAWNDKLKDMYGITLRHRVAMAEAQGHVCAACGAAVGVPYADGLVVDHCHTTGAVRGLLCGPCNLMLGHAKDDPARLRAGAAYLETRHGL